MEEQRTVLIRVFQCSDCGIRYRNKGRALPDRGICPLCENARLLAGDTLPEPGAEPIEIKEEIIAAYATHFPTAVASRRSVITRRSSTSFTPPAEPAAPTPASFDKAQILKDAIENEARKGDN